MDKKQVYSAQVSLLTKILPIMSKQTQFALKGGTAINLFIRNMPRLSVDIDLVYLPLDSRDKAIANIKSGLDELAINLERANFKIVKAYQSKENTMRLTVSDSKVSVKVELSPVMRGTVHKEYAAQACDKVQEQFGFLEVSLVSFEDLYAGKICAALGRQHPRDLYDIKVLLENEGITDKLRLTTIIYLLCSNRPLSELLNPNLFDISEVFNTQFADMTEHSVSVDELVEARMNLINGLKSSFTDNEKAFMLGFKQRKPDWSLLKKTTRDINISNIEALPAIKWKLLNLKKMNADKHKLAVDKLEAVLNA